MDSQLEVLEALIADGKRFTFRNFCNPHPGGSNYDGYAGEETPHWFEWTTRSFNLVTKLVTSKTPAFAQINEANNIRTHNERVRLFDRKKELILRALENTRTAVENDVFGELRAAQGKSASSALSNKIFIVHGHDEELKNETELFIRSIGLLPIVLHRQVDSGNTIIEKFEAHSDVGFAIILLTPDEIAYVKDQDKLQDDKRVKESRARPNVIFEFGYFVGKLSRKRVCCVLKGEVVFPSDLHGLIYKKVADSLEEIGMFLIRELKAAGYKVVLE
ncbi:MAG: nucleotide-binding protein [Nitrosospira sp.]